MRLGKRSRPPRRPCRAPARTYEAKLLTLVTYGGRLGFTVRTSRTAWCVVETHDPERYVRECTDEAEARREAAEYQRECRRDLSCEEEGLP